MTGFDDLFGVYSADRGRSRKTDPAGRAADLIDRVRRTFLELDRLILEVGRALNQAGYTVRLLPGVIDRHDDVMIDRCSETFVDYLRHWSQIRADHPNQGLHWEVRVAVEDYRRNHAEIALAVAVERPAEEGEVVNGSAGDLAFVEVWTTGEGVTLPAGGRAFQRALINAIIRLEDKAILVSRQPRR